MKPFLAMVLGTVTFLSTGMALAQNGNMMNGGGWMHGYGGMGGYGGILVPILIVAVVAGLVIWAVKRKGK